MIRWGDHRLRTFLSIGGTMTTCLILLAACSTSPFTGKKPPVTGVPPASQAPSRADTVDALEAATPFDSIVLQREIQRRREVLERAKGDVAQLESEVERSALNSWIQRLEDQVRLLEAIQIDMRTRSAVSDPTLASATRSRRLAARLLEALTRAPLEPPTATQTISWDPIRVAYREGDCAVVLDKYAAVSPDPGSDATVPVDVAVRHALCLARLGRISEAIGNLEPLLRDRVRLLDAHYLQYLLANWLYQEGEMARAEETYQSLLKGDQEREKWSDLAKLRLDQIRLARGQPTSTEELEGPAEPVLALPMPLEAAPREEAPKEETTPVEPPPSSGSPPPSLEEIRAARLREARHHLDNERYEQAIIAFQGLLGTEYDTQAHEGIRQAQDHYAETRRRRAASLVLEAHSEADPGKRKALLLRALGVLQETNTRYPGNRYADKIVQNIQDVVAQIQKVDPSFQSQVSTDLAQEENSP